MPFTEMDIRAYAGSNPDPQNLALATKVANLYLAKIGDNEDNKGIIAGELMMCLDCYIGNPPDKLIMGLAAQLNAELRLLRTPDRVALLLTNPPPNSLITKHTGISTAPTLPSELTTKFVFESDEVGVLKQHAFEMVGYRATTSDLLPALRKGGFGNPQAVANAGNGEQRGKGIYVGLGGSAQDVKHWAKLTGKPLGTRAVVLEIWARMGYMRGKFKPMAKFGSDPKPVKEQKFDKWDGKYDYVTGDINAMRGAEEVKFTETGLKDLRVVVAWEGIP